MKRVAMSRSHPSTRTLHTARPILAPNTVAAIERHLRRPGVSPHAVIDVEVGPDGASFGTVPLRAFPSEWSAWSVGTGSSVIGVCLPVDGSTHLGVALDRRGRSSWFVVDADGLHHDAPSACQLLDDACRMRLGFPTQQPERPPDWYWLGRWLVGVVDAAHREGVGSPSGQLDVITVASAHPAVDADELGGLDLAGLCGFVVERHRDHVQIADWECIHLDALNDSHHRFHGLAAAFDVGGFSRWVSAASSPLSNLAAQLTECCSPLALRLLGSVIADTVLREQVDPPP